MTVIYGDGIQCLESLNGKIEGILTSPPFKDEEVNGDYRDFYSNFMSSVIKKTLKVAIIIHSSTKLNELICKYPPNRLIIRGKNTTLMSYRYNPILVYQFGDYKVNRKIRSDVFAVSPVLNSRKKHKYEDPSLLYKTLISMFNDVETWMDPFCGSGTLGEVTKELGKYAILVDNDIKNVIMTKNRLSITQDSLFTRP